MRRLSVVLGLLAGLLLAGVLPALAVPPLRLDGQVTDEVGALNGEESRGGEALDRLRAANGTQLFVAYVSSFDGATGGDWADATAQQSQLGRSDVLLAVAVDDGAYGYWVAPGFPTSDAGLENLLVQDVEPELADGDWAGAVEAFADGLRADGGADAGSGTGNGGGAGSGVGTLVVVGGLAALAGGAFLVSRTRRRSTDATPPT